MRQNRGINRTFAATIIARAGLTPPVFPYRILCDNTNYPAPRTGIKPICNDIQGTEPHRTHHARRSREGLRHPHTHSGAGHSARTRRTRPDGLRPDRNGQDGGLHAADPAAALGPAPHQRTPPHQGAGAHAHARTGDPDRRVLPRLCPLHRPAPLRDLRRCQPASAGGRPAARHRPAGRHAGPPARPDRTGIRLALRHPLLRARRSRPDARHGFHPRHQTDTSAAAQRAADALLFGDDALGHRHAGQFDAPRPGARHRHSSGIGRRDDQPKRHVRREGREKRPAHQPAARTLRRLGAGFLAHQARRGPHRPHPHQSGHRGARHPRRQVAGGPRTGHERFPGGPLPRTDRHRHRRAGDRHQRTAAGHQLRPAGSGRNLRPPHRPHGTRRTRRHGDSLLLGRRTPAAERHPETDRTCPRSRFRTPHAGHADRHEIPAETGILPTECTEAGRAGR